MSRPTFLAWTADSRDAICRAAHDRYFQLKKMDKKAKQQFVEQRSAAYTSCVPLEASESRIRTDSAPSFARASFGAASLLLGLIPLFGPATAFTSAAGAALWAADLEKKSQGGSKGGELGGKDENVDVGVGHVEL